MISANNPVVAKRRNKCILISFDSDFMQFHILICPDMSSFISSVTNSRFREHQRRESKRHETVFDIAETG
jgi:hypothetical protein